MAWESVVSHGVGSGLLKLKGMLTISPLLLSGPKEINAQIAKRRKIVAFQYVYDYKKNKYECIGLRGKVKPFMVRFRFGSRQSSGKSTGPAGKLGLSVFFFFFLAMGSIFEVLIVRDFLLAVAQRSWRQVPCQIVSSAVEDESRGDVKYTLTVQYTYEFQGQTYSGSHYKRVDSSWDSYSEAQQIAATFPSGQTVTGYVDPGDPSTAVLKRDSLRLGLAIPFPWIFMLIGGGGIYFTWRKPKETQTKPIATGSVRSKRMGKRFMVGFFSIFALAGLGMLYPLGIKPILKTMAAEKWIEMPCKVLRAQVRSHSDDDGTTYSVYVLYEYEFNGHAYKSDRYTFMGGSSSGRERKARVVEQYNLASNPVCYVDPQNPSEAVLKRGFHAMLFFSLFPLPFILIGLGGLYFTLRKKREASRWRPRRAKTSRDDVLVLRQLENGPLILKPAHSPLGKFFGVVMFALIWNGVVSIFVFQVVGGFRHGHPQWFLTIFMVPFVLIGMGSVAFVVYQFLAIFNPRPRLELSAQMIPLGGAAELDWSFAGRVERIREMTLTLRGIEQATYQRGTKTHTDRHTFYELELRKATNPSDIARGQIGFLIPTETMHSFEAGHNKIIWSLDVHGDISRWPDVKESFPIMIVPPTMV